MVWYEILPLEKKLNKELGNCQKEIKPVELLIRGRLLLGHIVKSVGVSVSHEPDIDRKIRGATTVEEALGEATTEEEAARIAKELWKKKNKKKLTAQTPVVVKSSAGLEKRLQVMKGKIFPKR